MAFFNFTSLEKFYFHETIPTPAFKFAETKFGHLIVVNYKIVFLYAGKLIRVFCPPGK